MSNPVLRRSVQVLLSALAATSAVAAAPAADHPAVARARAHLAQPAALSADADQFEARDLIVDADGTEHVRFHRTHQGLRVIGGDVVVHANAAGDAVHYTRTLATRLSLKTSPTLSAAEAQTLALSRYAHTGGRVEGHELVIYARNGAPRLAWDVVVHGQRADGTPSEAHLIVSATGRQLLDAWDDIHTANAVGTGNGLHNGTVSLNTDKAGRLSFSMLDRTRGDHTTVDMKNGTSSETLFTARTNVWGNGTVSNRATAAADAAYGQAMTWDYFASQHGRSGIADDGRGARSRVHYSRNYINAFWSDSCFCMTYGDGDNGTSAWPLTTLDVAGHEMSHGVTSHTAGLIYSYESGGLNEATSDIFGTLVEFHANNAKDAPDWLIGEKVFTSGSPLRSMVKPSSDGRSADCWYPGVGGLDVHYSSGVANHFFYLLSEGTNAGQPSPTCVAGNTKVATGTGTLTGIGRDKAGHIWYRALTVYMTSSTDFAAARTATINAATDLYGAGSAETAAVAAAWTAVNRP